MADNKSFTRKQAAAYLTSIDCPVQPSTLAKYAANNNALGGPAYTRFRWNRVRYKQADLDAWAAKQGKRIE